eukprot:GHVN01032186.1.p1 GENE.GHVN01032186.1~~GHVN01032186.1.p1  ORF type:complete len:476 (+),score=81.15 GHVN01032186.1:140-1567(+)
MTPVVHLVSSSVSTNSRWSMSVSVVSMSTDSITDSDTASEAPTLLNVSDYSPQPLSPWAALKRSTRRFYASLKRVWHRRGVRWGAGIAVLSLGGLWMLVRRRHRQMEALLALTTITVEEARTIAMEELNEIQKQENQSHKSPTSQNSPSPHSSRAHPAKDSPTESLTQGTRVTTAGLPTSTSHSVGLVSVEGVVSSPWPLTAETTDACPCVASKMQVFGVYRPFNAIQVGERERRVRDSINVTDAYVSQRARSLSPSQQFHRSDCCIELKGLTGAGGLPWQLVSNHYEHSAVNFWTYINSFFTTVQVATRKTEEVIRVGRPITAIGCLKVDMSPRGEDARYSITPDSFTGLLWITNLSLKEVIDETCWSLFSAKLGFYSVLFSAIGVFSSLFWREFRVNSSAVERQEAIDSLEVDIDGWDSPCIICFKSRRDVIFVPCGHVVLCRECCNLLTKRECPMCKARIEHNLTVKGVFTA